jgi:hypothetical protein
VYSIVFPIRAGRRGQRIESTAVPGKASRSAAGAAILVSLALVLAACGGDDSTTTAGSGGGGATAGEGGSKSRGGSSGEGGSKAQGDGGSKAQGGEKGQGGGKPGSSQSGGGGGEGGSEVDPAPLKVSGGGSAQFRVKGGDNSIQNWGEESDEAQLRAAAEAVHDFYVARAREDWAGACAYQARSMVEQLEQFAGQSKEAKKPSCATLLEALTRHPLPAATWRETTVVDAGSLRVGEEHSFLIYRGAERTVYAMPLDNEDGAWKLTLLSPTPLG